MSRRLPLPVVCVLFLVVAVPFARGYIALFFIFVGRQISTMASSTPDIRSREAQLLNYNVVKSNRLVTAEYDWQPLKLKIFQLLVAGIRMNQSEFQPQTIDVKELARILNRSPGGKFYNDVRGCTQELMHDVMVIDHHESMTEEISVMDRCRYYKGQGYVVAKFNDSMAPYLLKLREKFIKYKLGEIMPLSSKYAIRIFELLMSFSRLHPCRKFEVDQLRRVLRAENVYSRPYDFKTYVLETAKTQIDEHCLIDFGFNEHRQGNSPVAYTFCVREKADVQDDDSTERPEVEEDLPLHERWFDRLPPRRQHELKERFPKVASDMGLSYNTEIQKTLARDRILRHLYDKAEEGEQTALFDA